MEWPLPCYAKLTDPDNPGGNDRAMRMQSLAGRGMGHRSHYSGKCTVETIFVFLNRVWQLKGYVSQGQNVITTYNACDKLECCQLVALPPPKKTRKKKLVALAHTDKFSGAQIKHVFLT